VRLDVPGLTSIKSPNVGNAPTLAAIFLIPKLNAMSNLEKIIEAINLPKRIVDGAELFLKKLFGPAITESGLLIGDEIKYRRFKNQVTIFSKANDFLASKNIDPKKIDLKLLVPLVEYSSLEEDEKMQITWANVIANIASYDTEQLFNLKCIEILKEITPNEILLLDFLFNFFKAKEKETLEKWKSIERLKDRTTISPDYAITSSITLAKELSIQDDLIDLYIDRLISFGIIKYEQPELSESNEEVGVSDSFTGSTQYIEVKSYELETSERIHFTYFGLYFVKLCKFDS
jgi:hypothetical protein